MPLHLQPSPTGPSALLLPPVPEQAAPRGTAITYGTFDLFHVGHVRLFQRIKQRYEFLIVAVSSDEFNAVKGKKSVMPFADRLELVKACRWVDLAIAETCWEQKEKDVIVYGADAFVMGDDWAGKFDFLKPLCDVVYLPRTEGVSSSLLKTDVAQSAADSRRAERRAAPKPARIPSGDRTTYSSDEGQT